ncbi:MAG: hypothetical protein ACHQ50_08005 [Fimbriimonadales bacterium]
MKTALGWKIRAIPGQETIAALMAAWVFLFSALQFLPLTPDGVQCPTAPVQTITDAVRDCCGKLVGYSIRAPQPGDPGFVQCRCAEKKSAQHKASVSLRADSFLHEAVQLPRIAALTEPMANHIYSWRYRSLRFPPSVLPPDLI